MYSFERLFSLLVKHTKNAKNTKTHIGYVLFHTTGSSVQSGPDPERQNVESPSIDHASKTSEETILHQKVSFIFFGVLVIVGIT